MVGTYRDLYREKTIRTRHPELVSGSQLKTIRRYDYKSLSSKQRISQCESFKSFTLALRERPLSGEVRGEGATLSNSEIVTLSSIRHPERSEGSRKKHLAPWGEAHEVCSTTLERCSKNRLLSSLKEVAALEKAAFIGQRSVLDEEPSKTTFTLQDYAREEGRDTTCLQTLALIGFEMGGGGCTQNPYTARLSAV